MNIKKEILETKYRESSEEEREEDSDPKASFQMRAAYQSFPADKIEVIPPGKSGIDGPINFTMRFPKYKTKKED